MIQVLRLKAVIRLDGQVGMIIVGATHQGGRSPGGGLVTTDLINSI